MTVSANALYYNAVQCSAVRSNSDGQDYTNKASRSSIKIVGCLYKGVKLRCGDSPHPLKFKFNHPILFYTMVTCYNMVMCCNMVMYCKQGKRRGKRRVQS